MCHTIWWGFALPHDILLTFNKFMEDNWREGLVTTEENQVGYVRWFCRDCGNERLWVSDGASICLKCDPEKHGFQAITNLLHEVIQGD